MRSRSPCGPTPRVDSRRKISHSPARSTAREVASLVTGQLLPEVFRARFATLEEQCPTTRPGDLFYHCFGCGPGHPTGLRVRCFKTDEGVLAPILVPRQYEGPHGGGHGGIAATVLAEGLAGAAVRTTGRRAGPAAPTAPAGEPVA